MSDEKEYHDRCDALFARMESLLEESGADFDSNGNVLETETEDGGTIVINRQPAAREIWLAAPNGGRHFRWQNGEWRDTRDDRELLAVLLSLI